MALVKKTHPQEVNRQFGGNDTVGYSASVNIVDINGVPLTVTGGGGALEATQQAVLAELLTKADEATLQSVLIALQSTLSVSVVNTALEITNDAGNPIPVAFPVTERVVTSNVVSVNGGVAAGSISVTFVVLTGTLTVNNVTLPVNGKAWFKELATGRYPAINYTLTGTVSLTVIT